MENTQLSQSELIKLVGSRLIIGIPVLLLILFLPAGTFAYWEAWIYLTILLIPMSIVMFYFLKKAPEFLARRMKFKEKEVEQKLIIKLSFIPFLLAFILPGIDKRLGWSNVPITIIVIAEILVFLGYIFVFLVFKENQFASRVIEVAKGQIVIQSGPYRLVRHPMYMGSIVMYIASPLALGSYWAIIPAIFIIPIFIARIINEESVLTKELEGYSDYKLKTRYRLIPGIW
ncbi:isoprenylcysteine carboxyl methyltransferase [Candidatus Moduliflexus flocculans]|uniref:Isoprenylcysteine carboxyl methyltransferase n=1 Tax=Candidatus Moduliflexus flocculans TaxID=1499966 RepID=A0A0S6W4W0_9BACT|nr:isoprenylcysteine carboxyl methyltransferase [Candidatus Moduliflexus flocculans]